ncbi:MAG: OmpA family protein [Desulfobacterales bacterium]|nr:OmpA family protein [Desulfobacterales bacterium]
MNRKFSGVFVVLMAAALIAGCATPMPPVFTPQDLNPELAAGNMTQKAENFMVVLDASDSMAWRHDGIRKFDLAKDIVSRLNRAIPNLTLQSALRSFGHGPCMPSEKTLLLEPLGRYLPEALEKGLGQIRCAGGNSPLEQALGAVGTDLQDGTGDMALIVVSDGEDMPEASVEAARQLKEQFGDRLCIYTIQVGVSAQGKALLESIAAAGECGFAVNAADITAGGDMADFVRKVFLEPAAPKPAAPMAPKDSDGDGVTDDRDLCPDTARGAPVDAMGCPLDSDGDGVYDYQDRCPGTPAGTKVDADGCPLDTDGDGVFDDTDLCPDTPKGAAVTPEGCWILTGVNFDTGKWDIRPEAMPILDKVVNVLQNNADLEVQIQGHTDNVGNAAFNKQLSQKRAQSVRQYLIDKGVALGRLQAEGFGLSRPMFSNDSKEGRAKNRRVQLKPIY